jgi:SAM-dependent methyltransferase
MLGEAELDAESDYERRTRDRDAAASPPPGEPDAHDALEMRPTMESLGPLAGRTVLELGCGSGRYTRRLARSGADVVAVDFSRDSLEVLARTLPDEAEVSLVHGDVTRLRLAPASVDAALSTLVSNLPTAGHRDAMYRLAAAALRPGGRLVFSTHYYGLRDWMRRAPRASRYAGSGIYWRAFRAREVAREAGAHFADVRSRRVQIGIPGAGRLGLPALAVSEIASRIPLLRELANILLVTATRPRPGSSVPAGAGGGGLRSPHGESGAQSGTTSTRLS